MYAAEIAKVIFSDCVREVNKKQCHNVQKSFAYPKQRTSVALTANVGEDFIKSVNETVLSEHCKYTLIKTEYLLLIKSLNSL